MRRKRGRKGRELEELIATLEGLLSGSNVEIKSPDYAIGVRSGGRREMDVSLRSHLNIRQGGA